MRLKGMVHVRGGTFLMGSSDFYVEERPVSVAEAGDLWVDEHLVTNAAFRRFVRETGHVTVAERAPDPADFPEADRAQLVAGSMVFMPPVRPVSLDDWTQWWSWIPGADWRHPDGPASTLHGRDRHPVVHVGFEDACAYALWAGVRLPTEAEWEHAARGGLDGATYAWGEEFMPRGRVMANTWHGRFPTENLAPHGYTRTSPVGKFAPNGFGLFDVTGNVWEWTSSEWKDDHAPSAGVSGETVAAACCGPPVRVGERDRFVMKGGSHLCAASYCHRYRPAARQAHGSRDTTSHLGFRCVRDA